jgi:hypothetical protein
MTEGSREATLQLLSRDALEHQEDLAAALTALLVAAEPPGFYQEEAVLDLSSSVRRGLVSILKVLSGEGTVEGALDSARATGRRQVQQALPLEGVLRSYRLVGKALWEHFVLTARRLDLVVGSALLDGAAELWRVIDLFSDASVEAYRAEEGQLRDHDDRVQSAVLAALLDGRGSDPQFARDATHALGVPTGGPFVCVVGLADAPDELALEHPRERLRMARVPSAWTTLAGSDVGLVALGSSTAHDLRALLAPAVRTRAGMSPVFTELAELPRARHLADTAARCPGEHRAVRVLEEDLVAGLVVDAPLVSSMLYEHTVGRLLAAEGADAGGLLSTLRVFLEEGGSLNAAAAKSFVHRNTMLYRLNKIERLTGLSVRELQDQVIWVLGLKEHDCRGR